MPSFSSVVRKPGQKIQPKVPKRNVQRNLTRHVTPPASLPESQTVSPAVEPVDDVAESQQSETNLLSASDEPPPTVPSLIPSIIPSIPVVVPSVERASDGPDSDSRGGVVATDNNPSVTVEVFRPTSTSVGIEILHPIEPSPDERRVPANEIPHISASVPSGQKRKATQEPTPVPSEDSVPPTEESRKRQKTASIADETEDSESRSPPPSLVSGLLGTSPRLRRSESRTSEALLQDAVTQAAAVSELANDIELRARAIRARSERRSVSQAPDTDGDTVEHTAQSRGPKSKKKRKSNSERLQDLARRVVEAATGESNDKQDGGGASRLRLSTPENAEELEIDPEQVAMSELTKDIKIGRKSQTEKRMRENWPEIKERRKLEVEKRREAAGKKKNPSQVREEPSEAEAIAVPKQMIINGVIVVANESREVAFGAGVERAVNENADVAIEDDRIYKNVNQGTVGKNAGKDHRSKWNEENTDLFYKGLKMFGTEFTMIASLLPDHIDRSVVKKKYLLELQTKPEKVEQCLSAKETVDLTEYAAMANMEFEDPDKLMKELEEEEKRMRAEDEKRRADQGYMMNHDEADIPLPSTETDQADRERQSTAGMEELDTGEDATTPAPSGRPQTANAARAQHIEAMAKHVVQNATNSKKKQQRRARESTGVGRGGRGGRKGKKAIEGLEERIDPSEDF
jgi:transcription factor TFIIIB component B''